MNSVYPMVVVEIPKTGVDCVVCGYDTSVANDCCNLCRLIHVIENRQNSPFFYDTFLPRIDSAEMKGNWEL